MLHLPKKKVVCIYGTYSRRAYHSGRNCKRSLAFIRIRHRCLHFRLHTRGGCLVVAKLASLVASCGGIGHQPINATNLHQPMFSLEGPHEFYDLKLSSWSVSALSGADGAAREHEMGANSRPGLIMSHHGMQYSWNQALWNVDDVC